jgi:hypothetical protein
MFLPLFHVDAFTDRPIAGNPVAVCISPPGAKSINNRPQVTPDRDADPLIVERLIS